MRTRKEILEGARFILKQSLEEDKINEKKLMSILSALKKESRSQVLETLEVLLRLVKTTVRKNTLKVSSSEKLAEEKLSEIRHYFEKTQGKKLDLEQKIDQSLIGGIKVSLGDTEWDFSIKEKLKNLKENLYV